MKFFDRNVQELILQVLEIFSCYSKSILFVLLVVILGPVKGGLNKRVTEIVM